MKKLILSVVLLASADATAGSFKRYQYQTGSDNLQVQSTRKVYGNGNRVVSSSTAQSSVSSRSYVAPAAPASNVSDTSLIKNFVTNSAVRNLFPGCTATTEAQIPAQQVLAYVEGPGFARGACIPFYCDADLNNNNILDVDELANRNVYTRVESCDAEHSTAGGYSLTGINAEAACLGNSVQATTLSAVENITVWVEDYTSTGSGTIRTGNCYWNTSSNQQSVFESSRLVCAPDSLVTVRLPNVSSVEICRKLVPSEATTAVANIQNEYQTGGSDGLTNGVVDVDCSRAYATATFLRYPHVCPESNPSCVTAAAFADWSRAQGNFDFTPRPGVANDSCSAQIATEAQNAQCRVNPSSCP